MFQNTIEPAFRRFQQHRDPRALAIVFDRTAPDLLSLGRHLASPGTDAEEKGYRVLFGEGTGKWKEILAAAESTGGVEFYLMEQEGSRYSELETAQRCLGSWRDLRGKA